MAFVHKTSKRQWDYKYFFVVHLYIDFHRGGPALKLLPHQFLNPPLGSLTFLKVNLFNIFCISSLGFKINLQVTMFHFSARWRLLWIHWRPNQLKSTYNILLSQLLHFLDPGPWGRYCSLRLKPVILYLVHLK